MSGRMEPRTRPQRSKATDPPWGRRCRVPTRQDQGGPRRGAAATRARRHKATEGDADKAVKSELGHGIASLLTAGRTEAGDLRRFRRVPERQPESGPH